MKTHRLPALAALALFAVGCAVADKCYAPADYPPVPHTYSRLASEMEENLKFNVLASWFPKCVDREHGGFYQHFKEDWSPGGTSNKFVVFQARMTWVAAQVTKRYPALAGEYLPYVRHGLDFLETIMWDRQYGGFFWALDSAGKPIEPFYGQKHAYGIAFGIYAASAAYEVTGDKRALDLAFRAFNWLEEHAHDDVNGGYYEPYTREGNVILTSDPNDPEARKTDAIGSLYGCKSMNAHIHLLEAVTELYRVSKDEKVRVRLEELFETVRDKIAVEPGCLNLYFTADWRPLPDHDSFGHDVETGFLLLEAAHVLGKPHDPKALAMARRLVDHALEWGWDNEHGGFYDRGGVGRSAHEKKKVWWTEAEGLHTLLLMHELFGSETDRYYNAFLKVWQFIVNHHVDHRHGGWYGTVSRDGRTVMGRDKGSQWGWKAAYHNVRALMNATESLRRLASQG